MGNCESSTHDKQIHPAKDLGIPPPPSNLSHAVEDSLQSPPPHIFDSIKGGPTFSLEPSALSNGTNPSGTHSDWLDVKDALNRNRQIEEQIMKDHRKLEKVIKLLLLGPAESGKSTILKQIKIIHLHGFSMADLGEKKPLIFRNIYESIIQLIKGAHSLGFDLPANLQTDIDTFCLFFNDYQFGDQMEFPKTMYPVVKRIWANERIKEVYVQRSDVYVMDCAKYFLENIDRICSESYIPTTTDVLYSRQQTIGVSEIRYNYKDLEFRIFDVGGQKNQRRKWIHLFDNVTSIFFIAAISEYDTFMREDTSTNRLKDALHLFRWIGNNDLFIKVQMILFLNKRDIFAEKIGNVPLTVCFPNYRFKSDYRNATAYIKRKFEVQITDRTKFIYTHLTCATDTDQVQFLMNSITDMIIAENFKQTGVL